MRGLALEATQTLQRQLKNSKESVELIFPASALEDIALALALAQGPTIQAIEVKLSAGRLLAPAILKALGQKMYPTPRTQRGCGRANSA